MKKPGIDYMQGYGMDCNFEITASWYQGITGDRSGGHATCVSQIPSADKEMWMEGVKAVK